MAILKLCDIDLWSLGYLCFHREYFNKKNSSWNMCYLNLNKLITNTEVISIIGKINSFISQFCLSSRALHFN